MLDKEQLQQYEDEVIELRRYFHRYPELANQEMKTAKFIEQYLEKCGVEVIAGLAGTGIIGIIRGSEGPTIAFRADMDALPVQEENERTYCSQNPNIMHACGHDGHLAVALITAKIVSCLQDRLQGTVKFIFQPAEENLPEGGAMRMVDEGRDVLDGVDAIFGFHFWPFLSTGTVAVSSEPMMAAGDVFEVTLKGQGSHGANPHQSSDVLMMACEAVLSLTSISLRSIKPGTMATLSIGVVKAGESANVLPSKAFIKGTTRYMDDSLKDKFPQMITRILEGVCTSYNGDFALNYQYGYPLLRNDPAVVGVFLRSARAIKDGPEVLDHVVPALASEDFAVFLEQIPGCYFWVGTQNKSSDIENRLHSPKFDLDEAALLIAVELHLSICSELLQGSPSLFPTEHKE